MNERRLSNVADFINYRQRELRRQHEGLLGALDRVIDEGHSVDLIWHILFDEYDFEDE